MKSSATPKRKKPSRVQTSKVVSQSSVTKKSTDSSNQETQPFDQAGLLKQGTSIWNSWRADNETQIDLTGASLANMSLEFVDLAGARNNINESHQALTPNMTGASFSRSNLREADLSYSSCIGANFNESELSGANFSDCNALAASFRLASGNKLDFSSAKLAGADFSEARLTGSNFKRCDLKGANLFKADLTDSVITDADLRGANLRDANLTDTDLRFTDFRGADLAGAKLPRALLGRADFSGANLEGASLEDALIDDAFFSGADISFASFPEQWGSAREYASQDQADETQDRDSTHRPPVFRSLFRRLQSLDEQVCLNAIASAGMHGDPRVRLELKIIALTHWKSEIRDAALKVVGRIEVAETLQELVSALKEGYPREHDHSRLASALGALKDVRAIEPLLGALNDNEDRSSAREAARALCDIDSPRAIGPLLEQLKKRNIYFPLYFEDDTQFDLIKTFLKRHQEFAVPPILEILEKEDDGQARYGALQILISFDHPRAILALHALSQNEDESVRAEALGALDRIKYVLRSNDGDYRTTRVRIIEEIEDARSAKTFVGHIMLFAGDTVPAGWVECAGQSYSIQKNVELFRQLGTTYGGDGMHTFALPDLKGCEPVPGSRYIISIEELLDGITGNGEQLSDLL